MRNLNAEIIATGSELLWDGRPETNSIYLADRLIELGFEPIHKSVVGDEERWMAEAIRQAASRAAVVLITGGLGPTEDDLTKKVVSRITGRRLILQEKLLEPLRRRFVERAQAMPAQIERQALMPARSVVIQNPTGSAPGLILHWENSYLICLPGVPHEMRSMYEATVRPFLLQRFPSRPWNALHFFRTYGLMESAVNERLADLMIAHRQVRIGLSAKPTGVDVRIVGRGRNKEEVRILLEGLLRKVEERLADVLYTRGLDEMEAVVGRLLRERRMKLAVAESCTGGLIGHRLTQVPGSSDYLDRVEVCYSNRAKVDALGVPAELIEANGAVSAPVVAAMARGIRRRAGTDIGLAVTGIAGPGGATPEKPVGLVYFGLDDGRAVQTPFVRFSGDRAAIKLRASQHALDLLRRALSGTTPASPSR
ncbi:MAG TPA: competence/damage-inducible protein A [Nitrospiria bacterium]|jgi:nicotinamide-nucleotide amidase|nr:competence/damage-inducible protein A [Nitrospiria bacterium]